MPHFGELAVAVDFKRIRTIGWSESADNSEARVLFAARRAFRYTSHGSHARADRIPAIVDPSIRSVHD
jgi:hypothetical protein